MATWLSEYKNLKNEVEKQISTGNASLEQLMLYQELLTVSHRSAAHESGILPDGARHNGGGHPVQPLSTGGCLHPVPDQGAASGAACGSEPKGQTPNGIGNS